MKKKLLSVLAVLVLIMSFSLIMAAPVAAQPGMGHGFYGTVKVGGEDAGIGTVITAQVDTTEYGSCTVATLGTYALIVQGDVDTGATIRFYVDGQEADQTFPFTDGYTTKLDLTAPAPAEGDAGATVETEVVEDIIEITIDPTSFNFGQLRQGECSEPQSVTITSTSNMDIVVSTSTESLFYTESLSIGVEDNWALVNVWSADIDEGGSLLTNLKVCVPDPWDAGIEIGTIIFWAEEDVTP